MIDVIRSKAISLGFDGLGIAQASEPPHASYFQQWLAEGRHATMHWLEREPECRTDPTALLATCRSIIMLGMNYYQPDPQHRGVIAKYALGKDYHDLIMDRLKEMKSWLNDSYGGEHRPFVDTSAVTEKLHAARSTLGWQAKNTMLVSRQFGNWLALGGILTSLELPPDEPEHDRCGSCTRCIDCCPTNAITAPYQLDARRCIAYLTIEHKGSIPHEFREAIGNRLFGCDDCLAICPWNRWAQETREAAFKHHPLPDLREMLYWSDADFRSRFRGTPIFRLKWNRWLRNICVVLGNIGTVEDLPALQHAASLDEPLISEHAKWAITMIRKSACK